MSDKNLGDTALQKIQDIEQLENSTQLLAKIINQNSEDNSTTPPNYKQRHEEAISRNAEAIKSNHEVIQQLAELIEGLDQNMELMEEKIQELQEEVKEDSEEEQEAEEAVTRLSNIFIEDGEIVEDVECPECGANFKGEKPTSFTTHIAAKKDHKDPAEYFKHAGTFYCPECDFTSENGDKFTQHMYKKHDAIASAIIDFVIGSAEPVHEELLEMEDSVFDKDGNLKARRDRKFHLDEYSRHEIEEEIYNYLENQDQAYTQRELINNVFNDDYKSGSKEYTKIYEVLTKSDRIQSNKKDGLQIKYSVENQGGQ